MVMEQNRKQIKKQVQQLFFFPNVPNDLPDYLYAIAFLLNTFLEWPVASRLLTQSDCRFKLSKTELFGTR